MKSTNKSKTLKRVGNVTENRYAFDAIKAYYPVYPVYPFPSFPFIKGKLYLRKTWETKG